MIDFFNKVIAFFNFIIEFINRTSYDFFVECMEVYIVFFKIAMIDLKEYFLTLSVDLAMDLISQLDLSGVLASSYAGLDSKLVRMMLFFNIPTAINSIISAVSARFIISYFKMF